MRQTLLLWSGDLCCKRKARDWIKRLGQSIDELLDVGQVFLSPTVEVFQEEAGERVRVFLVAKALSIFQQLRGGWLRGACYSARPGGQACRAPQRLTRSRIFTGSPRSGWWLLHGARLAGSREVWQRVALQLDEAAPR